MIFDDNSKIILSNLHKNSEAILMSTHNIGFYKEISKIITFKIANFTPSFPEICREAPNFFRIKIIDQSKLTAK